MRDIRKAAGMSQRELASLLKTSRCTINRIEQGKQQPHQKLKARIDLWAEQQKAEMNRLRDT